MTISYKWLSDYLPVTVDPERLSRILTSIGLEVERFEKYEEVTGGLDGLVVGHVLEVSPHPNADKLKLTRVDVGNGSVLRIVCGAPNVARNQKVIVATVGTTIYPVSGAPLTMKTARIRGEESQGMICAEDEIGLGTSHEGIMILPESVKVGMKAADYFKPYSDWIYEIGLTPNRMDAMSHWGVARDVCAYLSHHDKKGIKPKLPQTSNFTIDNNKKEIGVSIENTRACQRYSGISISGVTIAPSPRWLQQRLKSIGLRPINNIVDITNFIQHETGQPLHAFDADQIRGGKVIVKNLPEGTPFVTLDEKERKLSATDLMICDAEGGMCIAGVFGGLHSGVTEKTTSIFLESAWFNPIDIRKTSFRHGLRTDAASRFEKGIDISGTVLVLKRAITMIRDIAGGTISSNIVDVYPAPKEKTKVGLKYHYLKKLSGKSYHPDTVEDILQSLGFDILKEGMDELWVAVPHHKPDVALPADVVEEILRIDGLDNIPIPAAITITPAVETHIRRQTMHEKAANYLVGAGFFEIMTNSITNSQFFNEAELEEAVPMLNSLSAELNIMRPSMLETGLHSVAHNLNRKNNNLRFFEFGKTYKRKAEGGYEEKLHLCLFLTGKQTELGWKQPPPDQDFYLLKGVVDNLFSLAGVPAGETAAITPDRIGYGLQYGKNGSSWGVAGSVAAATLDQFDIRQPVLFADLDWDRILEEAEKREIEIQEIPKFPYVQRDLSILVAHQTPYAAIEDVIRKTRIATLEKTRLFDLFENEKLGAGKKSLAISFTFYDKEKTLTDKEIDGWMQKIIRALEKELNAEIRK